MVTVRPAHWWTGVRFDALWYYRELLYFLIWREIKVRYKQTFFGFAWVWLQPLAMMVVFTMFFGRLAKVPSDGIAYPVFAYIGLMPWQVFSRSLTESANSVVTDQRLITRVYFPRIIVPLATTLAAGVDLLVASILVVPLFALYTITPSINIVFLPAFVLLMGISALGVAFWLSALNVEFRDVRYVLPFLSQLWLFITPVVYPTSMVPEKWRIVYGLNPMTGVIDGFRWAFLGANAPETTVFVSSTIVALVVFLTGAVWFYWREGSFADTLGSGGR